MQYVVIVKIRVAANTQGEALAVIEKRVRANGTAEDTPARVVETISIKDAKD